MLSHNINIKKKQCSKQACRLAVALLLLFILFFLSSCNSISSNSRTKQTNYYSGTKGLELEFLKQAPQNEIYEDSRFVVGFIADNAGASDVIEADYATLSVGFDPFYIDASELSNTDQVEAGNNFVIFRGLHLYGRSQLNPSGESVFISFPGFKARKILGQIEKPSTQLLASLCYPYVTIFSGVVCVDLSLAGQDLRQQVCYQSDLNLADQGAPVAITKIEVENQPTSSDLESAIVRPVFTIHVQNKGSGTVLSPVPDAASLDRVCSFQDITRQDFNTVNIEATLSVSTVLTCTPNPIKLYGDEGITRCEVNDEDLSIGSHNYETPLNVRLSYVYQTAISKKIDIKRINVYGTQATPSSGCLDFEVASGGGCRIKCDVCAESSGAGCQLPADPLHPEISINFQRGFACQCSDQMCNDLYPKGLCIPFPNYCPGVSYCCLPPCTGGQIRLSDGKCYPKCSKCSLTGITKDGVPGDCACGPSTSTDASNYVLVTKGNSCCNIQGLVQSFGNVQSCVNACTTAAARTTAPSTG